MIKVATVTPSKTLALGMQAILARDPKMQLVKHYEYMVNALDGFQDTVQDVALISLPRFEFSDYSIAQNMVRKHRVNLVAYTHVGDREFVTSWLSAGGTGCLSFEDEPAEIIEAVRRAALGNSYVSQKIRPNMNGLPTGSTTDLSGRECEVLRLIAMGYTQNDIAARLFISRKTVETHRARIGRKLGAENRTELVRYALVNGLVNPGI